MESPDIGRAVNELLEAAWPRERRRARLLLVAAAVGRVAIFLLALGALGIVVYLAFGLIVPWTFYAFTGGLALFCARPEREESKHLRRRGEDHGRGGRPSTGCYPRGGCFAG